MAKKSIINASDFLSGQYDSNKLDGRGMIYGNPGIAVTT
jgi:hypothetical protein